MKNLIAPHWWELIDCFREKDIPNTDFEIEISKETITDIRNIWNWTYSPLKWFLKKDDFISVCENMKLSNWILWSIPIIFDISEKQKKEIENKNTKYISLINKKGEKIAILKNEEIYNFNKNKYANFVFGTTELEHPWVNDLYKKNDYLIWWEIITLSNNSKSFCLSPTETRKIFSQKWWKNIVAFQTRNPPHVSHEYLQKCALEWCDWLYINPIVWKKKTWDFNDKYIIGAYEILIRNYYNSDHVTFWALTLNMKYAWPREAILHAIIRQNLWCSHLIIWRDHAWVWSYYWTYEAQNIFDKLEKNNLKIKILKYENAWFCTICRTVTTSKTCPHDNDMKMHISWSEIRRRIKEKEILPWDFIRKEISEYLIEWKDQFVE